MLPYSPLHHLLLQECRFPLIATSGNRSDEPIAIANDEAVIRLKDIADHFLMHERPIVRACDDSVVRLTRGRAGICAGPADSHRWEFMSGKACRLFLPSAAI